MGIFSRKQKKEEKKEADMKSSAKVKDGKKNETVKPEKKEKKKLAASAKPQKAKSMKELYGEQEIKTPATVKTGKKEKKTRQYGNAYKILIKPLITEKAANLGAEDKYVFEVGTRANKIEISKAINEVYGIKPVSVNIINMQGKKIRSGRYYGRRKSWKKAIVKLPAGKTIDIYEGV